MAAIGPKNTGPELQLRKALHRRGHRYRLYSKGLPGKPDLVFPRRNAVIFMHGCFWHLHGCYRFKWPKQNRADWRKKLEANMERDRRQLQQLKHDYEIRTLIVWECALTGKQRRPMDEVVQLVDRWFSLVRDDPSYWSGSIQGHE
jgi:DNA mismatch endonuclease (patch repair protein)